MTHSQHGGAMPHRVLAAQGQKRGRWWWMWYAQTIPVVQLKIADRQQLIHSIQDQSSEGAAQKKKKKVVHRDPQACSHSHPLVLLHRVRYQVGVMQNAKNSFAIWRRVQNKNKLVRVRPHGAISMGRKISKEGVISKEHAISKGYTVTEFEYSWPT